MSQSLWNRAVSYDINVVRTELLENGLNPFGTGQCLTTETTGQIPYKRCLNPFGTGQCLTTLGKLKASTTPYSLNPFGTGQCLTTTAMFSSLKPSMCLNPFGTGQCLTTQKARHLIIALQSQSLWNRAVSYDL